MFVEPKDWNRLTPLKYGAILADPAWKFRLYSEKGEHKSPQRHYRCMPLSEIQALPVDHLASRDCVLFLWATFPMLPEAIQTMSVWGFTYKTGIAWAKQSKTGKAWNFGPGYWVRSSAELLLIGTLGKPKPQARNQRNLIVQPVREHSRKPDEQYNIVENVARGPYCELFSRSDRHGWDSWGDQVGTYGVVA